MSALSRAYFHNETEAFAYLESIIWADGVSCPHCGAVGGRVYDLSDVRGSVSKKNPEGAIRHGLKKCGECRKQFTVKVGTVFEHGRMPLHKMLQAVYLMTSSKKGISSHQLHRVLEITYKSAWFLAHRIREAMRDGQLARFGSDGGMVEVDETYIGHRKGVPTPRAGQHHKMKVLSLVERSSGKARSFVIDRVSQDHVWNVIGHNLAHEAHLMTDEARVYRSLADNFAAHSTVNHFRGEYVNADNPKAHTNTIEGFFSIFKRGMRGVYQHCSEKHLHRYLAEFDFRYSNRAALEISDVVRSQIAMKGISGKRLAYKSSGQRQKAAV